MVATSLTTILALAATLGSAAPVGIASSSTTEGNAASGSSTLAARDPQFSFPSMGSGFGFPSTSTSSSSGSNFGVPSFGTGTSNSGTSASSVSSSNAFSIPSFSTVGGTTSANDITSQSACKSTTLLFARGTSEPGNMGSTVGPALQTQLSSALNADLATQGITYPADVNGAIQGSLSPKTAQGATTMASLAKEVVGRCPETKVVLAGYSQGAQQVHGALMAMEDATLKNVAAVVTFGDPLSKTQFQGVDAGRTKVFCATGDQVCEGMFVITAAHLSYASASVPEAVEFIKGKLE